jgi:hypothetical protein
MYHLLRGAHVKSVKKPASFLTPNWDCSTNKSFIWNFTFTAQSLKGSWEKLFEMIMNQFPLEKKSVSFGVPQYR